MCNFAAVVNKIFGRLIDNSSVCDVAMLINGTLWYIVSRFKVNYKRKFKLFLI